MFCFSGASRQMKRARRVETDVDWDFVSDVSRRLLRPDHA